MLDSVCRGSKRTFTFFFLPMLGATSTPDAAPERAARGGGSYRPRLAKLLLLAGFDVTYI
jgi:hypothetical protein